jgi:amino acid transporter
LGAAVFLFAFAGYWRIATNAAEVERPRRNILVGIVSGFAVSAVVFLLVGALTLGSSRPTRSDGDLSGRGQRSDHQDASASARFKQQTAGSRLSSKRRTDCPPLQQGYDGKRR